MQNEIEKQLLEQSKMIAELTGLVGKFISHSIEKTDRNDLINDPLLLAKNPEKCYNISIQNSEGGSKKGQIAANSKRELNEEEIEFMRLQKNVRLRKDGRFEWQKMIAGEWHREIDKDYTVLKSKIAGHMRELKKILKHTRFASRLKKECPILFDLCKASANANRRDVDKLQGVLNKHLSKLTRPIDEYSKSDILIFLRELPIQPIIAYQVLKLTFAEATEEGIIERNPIATLKCPKFERNKGRWFTLSEQKVIHARKHESGMADEIDFYLMTGCRANEAMNCAPDFDKCLVYVERSKIDGTSGNVRISEEYCKILKTKWHTMFKAGNGQKYGLIFNNFLIKIGLKQKELSLHSLRHTFCSNLYYLGAPDKYRQHAMGHKDSRMTSDRYTTYDPNITRQDILAIYNGSDGNLVYPNFDINTAMAS